MQSGSGGDGGGGCSDSGGGGGGSGSDVSEGVVVMLLEGVGGRKHTGR